MKKGIYYHKTTFELIELEYENLIGMHVYFDKYNGVGTISKQYIRKYYKFLGEL